MPEQAISLNQCSLNQRQIKSVPQSDLWVTQSGNKWLIGSDSTAAHALFTSNYGTRGFGEAPKHEPCLTDSEMTFKTEILCWIVLPQKSIFTPINFQCAGHALLFYYSHPKCKELTSTPSSKSCKNCQNI